MYMSLRHLGHSWRDVESFLTSIGGMTIKTCHKWANILVNKDFDEFTIEGRGGKTGDSFWDSYPDLELEAKQFVFEECSKKEATFTVDTLARFSDNRFYELNNVQKVDQRLVRPVESCKLGSPNFGRKEKCRNVIMSKSNNVENKNGTSVEMLDAFKRQHMIVRNFNALTLSRTFSPSLLFLFSTFSFFGIFNYVSTFLLSTKVGITVN